MIDFLFLIREFSRISVDTARKSIELLEEEFPDYGLF